MRDRTTYKAKKEGYRARSVYKLFQLNNRFRIIKKNDKVLDLGCFPGSWSQAILKIGAKPTGIDITQIKKIPGMIFIRGDVKDEKIIEKLGKFDVIISDLSPKLSGIKEIDDAKSLALIFRALEISKKHLKKNGNFLCKIFQNEDTSYFLEMLRNNFRMVRINKPEASKKRSNETYIIAKGFN